MSDFISPGMGALGGSALSFIGGLFQQSTNKKIAAQQMAFQAQQQAQAQAFNAQQAGLSRDFDAQQAAIQRDWAGNQAAIVRDYETGMANTAYQRARADMLAAGLNPILMAGRGGAATPQVSAPSGASAHGSAASSPSAPSGASWHAENVLGHAASSGLAAFNVMVGAKEAVQRIEQSGAQTVLFKSEAERVAAQKAESEQNAAYRAAETARVLSLIPGAKDLQGAQTAAARAAAAHSSAAAGLATESVNTERARQRHYGATADEASAGAVQRHQQSATESYRTAMERERLEAIRRFGSGHLGEVGDTVARTLAHSVDSIGDALAYIQRLGRGVPLPPLNPRDVRR